MIKGARPLTLAVLGLLAALKAAALVGIAQAVATGIVAVIDGSDWRAPLVLGLASGLLRAVVTWAAGAYATRAAIGEKERLRGELAERLVAGSSSSTGSASVVGTLGLDELDNYYRTALPAVITAAVVPLLIGARILFADPLSALIIIVTVPLVPVFMALVGLHTRDRADAASAALQRLSDNLVELARGLPVLVGLGRVDEQSAALRETSERHRVATLATLRTAFLSSLVLELISTISVAVVAVFVGVRLVYGELPLEIGLLALVLAPECFAPFRELGSAFHSSQDGLAAMRRARAIIDEPVAGADVDTLGQRPGPIVVTDLTVEHDDRNAPAVDGLSFTIPRGSITSIEGASGAGKSTVLGALAGIVEHGGTITGIDAADVAWVPQHPHTVAATVRDEVRLYANDEESTDATLAALALTHVAAADPARVSPGELRRVAVARGLVRVAAGSSILLLDEPTAHLDPAHARLVEHALRALSGVTIVIASHEAGVAALADHRVLLSRQGGVREVSDEALQPERLDRAETSVAPTTGALAELAAFLRPVRWRFFASILLGTAASLAAVTLTAVSGWLIVRASEEPSFMYLMVAIVGVRFFGIARAVLRYAERLLTHDAVFGAVTGLRARVWAGLAARGPASRALASGGAALDYVVSSADRVRDLVPRVILPPAVAIGTAIAAVIAFSALHAPAVSTLLGGLLVSLLVAPIVGLAADRHAARGIAEVRSTVVREFTAMVAAAPELRANGIGSRVVARLAAADARAGRLARSTAWALGLGQAIVVAACVTTAVLMLPLTAPAVADGSLPPAIVAVLVLVPLGLIEPLASLVDSVQQWPALAAALTRVRAVSAPVPMRAGAPVASIESLALLDVRAGWAGSAPFASVSAAAERGDWIVVEGPSGAGKSTLLATIMGYVPAASGAVVINGVPVAALDPSALRARIAWCPQESHLFDSTVRGNLLLARAHDDKPTDEELLDALDRVGLGPLVATLDDGLDTRVGPAGDRLSGGERQRLAVARTLLTNADVVLLDEPTAHLDARAAEQLMHDLRFALRDRIVVLVSHHASERAADDILVHLGINSGERAEQVSSNGRVHGLGVARVVDAGEHVSL